MPSTDHLQAIGTVIGAGCAAALAWWAARREARKPASPPPERVPAPSEVRAALDGLRERVDRHAESLGGDVGDLQKSIDRLERMIERMSDRLDTDARIGTALARINRQDGGR